MAGPCNNVGTKKELDLQERGLEFIKFVKDWNSNKQVKVSTGGRDVKQIGKLRNSMDKYIGDVFKASTGIGRMLKLPEAILRKHPATKIFFDDLVRAEDKYRGFQSEITSDLNIGFCQNMDSSNLLTDAPK